MGGQASCAVWSIRTKTWNALFRNGMKNQALEVFGLSAKDSSTKDDSEGADANTPQKRKALESYDSAASTQKQCKGALSMMLNAKTHNEAEANSAPPQKRKLLGSDEITSDQKRRKIDEGGNALCFKVRDVVEVQQQFHSCNDAEAANFFVGQRGSVVKIDAKGDVLIHFHDYRNALQWVWQSDLAKLRLLPVPKSVAKKLVVKVDQQLEAASTTVKAATDFKREKPGSKAATDSNKDEPDSKATADPQKDVGNKQAAANSKKEEESVPQATDSYRDEPDSEATSDLKRDEHERQVAADSKHDDSSLEAKADLKRDEERNEVAKDSKSDEARPKAAVPKTEEEKKQRKVRVHTLLETYEDFSVCSGDACIEFT